MAGRTLAPGLRAAQVAGSVLSVLVVVVVVLYAKPVTADLLGLPYLLAAALASVYGLMSALPFRVAEMGNWRAGRTEKVAVSSAWVLAVLGVLNISAGRPAGPHDGLVLSYLAAAVGFAAADSLVALADSSDQEGGPTPLYPWGLPRSRRLFLWALGAIPLAGVLAGGLGVVQHGPPYPSAFGPPRLGILVVAAFSVLLTALVAGRYRAPLAKPPAALYPGAAVLILVVGGATAALGGSAYLYTLSTVSVVCAALNAHMLLGALPRTGGAVAAEEPSAARPEPGRARPQP